MSVETLTDALKRYLGFVVHPEQEWTLVVAQNPSITEALFPFSAMGLFVSVLCGVLGIALRIGMKNWPLELIAHLVIDASAVAAFAGAAVLVVRRLDAVRPRLMAVSALYSATGIWIASLVAFVPIPALGWLRLAMGAVYTAYLFYRSLDLAVGVPGHARLLAMGVPLGAMVVAGGLARIAFTVVLSGIQVW